VRLNRLATAHSGFELLLQYGRAVMKKRMIAGSALALMLVAKKHSPNSIRSRCPTRCTETCAAAMRSTFSGI
jgi:hypothetical protein